MKKTTLFQIAIVGILITGCTSVEIRKRIVRADRMLDTGTGADTVMAILDSIGNGNRMYGEDKALMTVVRLKAMIGKNDIPENDSMAAVATQWYGRNDSDSYYAATAYYQRGFLLENFMNETEKAIKWLKRAETIAERMDCTRLCRQIYTQMNNVNNKTGNNSMALDYALKALDCARKTGDSTAMANSMHSIGTAYYLSGMKDSAYRYTEMSIPYAKHVKADFRPYYLNRIGTFVFNTTNDAERATEIFMKALKERPVPDTYYALAQIMADIGRHEEAEKYWELCVNTHETSRLIRIPDNGLGNIIKYYEYKTERGDWKGACRLATRIMEMKDSLVQTHRAEQIAALQMKYDHELQELKAQRQRARHAVIVTLLIAVIALLTVYHRFRANRARRKIMDNQMLIEAYTKKINSLETSGKDNAKETELLKTKISQLHKKQAEILYNGHRLYRLITEEEGTAATWRRSDFIDFVEYYRLIDLPFVHMLETCYDNLSPKNMFFKILYNMGMTDSSVQRILGIGQSTIRTTRTRIKQKEKVKSEE